MPQTVFIAGAGTEIGKTYVTAALTRRLREGARRVRALKPLASGVPAFSDPAFHRSDTARLLTAQGVAVTWEAVEACSPWRFAAALAPDRAAALEGCQLDLATLVAWCRARIAEAEDRLLIEGVGGLMSPITPDATGLDWLKALDVPVLLVTGSYLGAISHALTAVETLRLHAVPLLGIVVSQSPDAPDELGPVASAIRRRVDAPVHGIERDAGCPDALAASI